MKKITIIFLSVSCLIILVSSIAFSMNNRDVSDFFFRFGLIERELKESISRNDAVPFIETSDFSISEVETNTIEEQFKLTGVDNGRKHAIDLLLRREILYCEALKQGFSVDHKELTDVINANKEIMRAALNYESDILQYFSGLGMAEEEYWESRYDVFKKEMTISKLTSAQRESIREMLYIEALSNGFTASHEEIEDLINFNIEGIRSSPIAGIFMRDLTSLGMTLEEYWEAQYDDLKHEIAISKHLAAQGISLSDSPQYESISNKNAFLVQEAIESRLESYIQELIDDYIEANDLLWVFNKS